MKTRRPLLTILASVAVAILITGAPIPARAVTCGAPTGSQIDLTGGGSFTVNGGIVRDVNTQPTGSGSIDSFVRISTNDACEQGYNTSGRPVPNDENTSPTFTKDLLLSAVPIVTINGVQYREFLLDINQTNADSLLSLESILIFQSNTGGQTSSPLPVGTLIWSLDGAGDQWVNLDYALNSGSGSGDMFLDVPNSLFTGEQFVYLFSRFGDHNNNNDGFEEWAVQLGAPTVPEPSTLLLLGSGLLAVGYWGRKRFMR